MKKLKIRIPTYFLGLFILTVGIAFSVKSDLGVSPVSSIPYTMEVVWKIDMGFATVLFHIALVLVQFILLRKKFKLKSLLQIGVGIIFGLFTSLCNYLVSFIPSSDNIAVRIAMLMISIVIVAVGIFFYVPADIIPLAGEGTMLAISEVTGIKFSTVKIGFDVTISLISLVTCLIAVHGMGSVGAGTIVSAVLTGIVLGFLEKIFGKKRDKWLKA